VSTLHVTQDQGQQPHKPLPVHPAIHQKARSVQVQQSWDRETEKQLLSQGHQTVKQPPLTEWLLSTDSNLLPFLKLSNLKVVSLVTLNNTISINVYIPYITHLICVYTIYCILPTAIAHPYVHTLNHPFTFVCV
jgi:hypothetical protein